MAPEGGSNTGRRLHKLKTGPARIALNAEEANGFKLGLEIQPIGLNYSNPAQFRGHLLSIMGEPIRVAEYQQDWLENPVEAVRKLTDHIKEKMEELLIVTVDEEEDELLKKVELLQWNEEIKPPYQHFKQAKNVLSKMQEWRSGQPGFYLSFKDKVNAYFAKLALLQIQDYSIRQGGAGASFFWLAALSPFALIGYLIHFLPAYFTKRFCDALTKDPTWVPTYKVMGGLIIYPLTLIFEGFFLVKCMSFFLGIGGWVKWLYLASIIPAGLAADWFRSQWPLFRSGWRYRRFAQRQPVEAESLVRLRNEILDFL
jgi:hypothetical protein